jgi:hypothetical protein
VFPQRNNDVVPSRFLGRFLAVFAMTAGLVCGLLLD